jgi:hypothetical protein
VAVGGVAEVACGARGGDEKVGRIAVELLLFSFPVCVKVKRIFFLLSYLAKKRFII